MECLRVLDGDSQQEQAKRGGWQRAAFSKEQ